MFDLHDSDSRDEKCYTFVGKLPAFIDPKQPPTKKSPFSAVLGHPFVHSTELILPEEIYHAIWDSVSGKIKDCQYAKVIMPLSSLLEKEFFNTYIKIGDVLMISEGRRGVDKTYSLRDGVLRLELDRNSYERAGLVGRPVRSGGRKHVKSRYVVEINLRLPSMLHGKKGFERVVWAFKNVLNSSVSWLFCDLTSIPGCSELGALSKHHPQIITCIPEKTALQGILTPPLHIFQVQESDQEDLQESCRELSEWLALVSLNSPRVHTGDSIDPYLSRYVVPRHDDAESSKLVKLSWKGLIPPGWVTQLLITML